MSRLRGRVRGGLNVVRYPGYYVVTDSTASPNPLGGHGIVYETRSRHAAHKMAFKLRVKALLESEPDLTNKQAVPIVVAWERAHGIR